MTFQRESRIYLLNRIWPSPFGGLLPEVPFRIEIVAHAHYHGHAQRSEQLAGIYSISIKNVSLADHTNH